MPNIQPQQLNSLKEQCYRLKFNSCKIVQTHKKLNFPFYKIGSKLIEIQPKKPNTNLLGKYKKNVTINTE